MRDAPTYVETPQGIFTESGVWFQTTEAALRRYAGSVLERAPLPGLLRDAAAWLRLPESLVVWLLPALLSALPIVWAVLLTVALYVAWRVLAPGLVSLYAARAAVVLDVVWLQALYTLVVLSLLAMGGQQGAMAVGLAGFVLARWGLLERATQPVVRPLHRRLYALPVPDQVLRALLIRHALKHRLPLPGLDEMTREVVAFLQTKK